MQWKALAPRPSSSSKDRPEKTYAHAAAAVGRRMYVFGGQQKKDLLRRFFVLDLDCLTWTKVSNSSLPSARAGHAMATAEGSIFLFGGQGKALSNDLHRCGGTASSLIRLPLLIRGVFPSEGGSFAHHYPYLYGLLS